MLLCYENRNGGIGKRSVIPKVEQRARSKARIEPKPSEPGVWPS